MSEKLWAKHNALQPFGLQPKKPKLLQEKRYWGVWKEDMIDVGKGMERDLL